MGHFEALLRPSWGYLGPSWGSLGPSWGILGRLGSSWGRLEGLGRFGTILEPFWGMRPQTGDHVQRSGDGN